MADKLAWGIIGTGNIAKVFAKGLKGSKTGKLVAVASRSQASADKFGVEGEAFLNDHPPIHRHGSYEAILADKDVQAVYISTPHPMHAEWAIKAAEAGKHILCEKPLTLNYGDAMAVVEAAKRHDVFLMEAFMYRCHPATAKIVELIKEKAIGDVRAIQCNFAFHAGYNLESRLLSPKLGGGGILDVGCYCTSFARLIAGAATGKDIAEPIEVKATGHVGAESTVDEYTFAVLKFPGEIIATVGTGVQCGMDNTIKIYGSGGTITVPWLWIPAEKGTKIIVNAGGKSNEITVDAEAGVYSLEADTVAQYLDRRQAASPAMTWADTLGNMRTLDQWREQLGVVYHQEKIENSVPASGRPLAVRKGSAMSYAEIAGVGKPVSRLIFGVDKWWGQATWPHAYAIMDDYFERGGNTFDCAYMYGNNESVLGNWVKSRKVREKVVILAKGAHAPQHPFKMLRAHLEESLGRYQTDYVDIYMCHRDDPSIPIDEYVDVLNELKKEGKVKAFGGSNWTAERVDAFNAAAKKKGSTGFCGVSNNLSLARMVDAVWKGCIAASEPGNYQWHVKTQTPCFSWSSQARGFFTERGEPTNKGDAELVRCWHSAENFKRRERATELAKKKGVLPIQIALAYVLQQPFPTLALIGPFNIDETASSFAGLGVKLTADEVKWLDLRA